MRQFFRFLCIITVLSESDLDIALHVSQRKMGVTQQQQQQLQQHMQVSRKRSSEQGENGCPEKSKKPKEKTEATKADLEDGANMSIQVEQVTLLSQQYIPTGV